MHNSEYVKMHNIDYENAIDILFKNAITIGYDLIEVRNALQMASYDTVLAPISTPAFNNSAMDGYAVSSQATENATKDNPILFEIDEEIITAGLEKINTKTTCNDEKKFSNISHAIMTGAYLPCIYDAVIPVENSTIINKGNKRYLAINEKIKKHTNVRLEGEDFKKNDIVVRKGEIINSNILMSLYSLGISKIKVFKKIKIALITTGPEIVSTIHALKAKNKNKNNKVYDSNSPYINSCAKALCEYKTHHLNLDDIYVFNAILKEAIDKYKPNIVISFGAVSKGTQDFIPNELKKNKAEILFHGVNIKPGKPILFANLQDGIKYFGLPGNPIASVIGYKFFVLPFIKKSLHIEEEKSFQAEIVNMEKIQTNQKLLLFLKAKYKINNYGKITLEILDGQQSFMIKPLLETNCWVCVNTKNEIKCYFD